jgi:hypothetical protein
MLAKTKKSKAFVEKLNSAITLNGSLKSMNVTKVSEPVVTNVAVVTTTEKEQPDNTTSKQKIGRMAIGRMAIGKEEPEAALLKEHSGIGMKSVGKLVDDSDAKLNSSQIEEYGDVFILNKQNILIQNLKNHVPKN